MPLPYLLASIIVLASWCALGAMLLMARIRSRASAGGSGSTRKRDLQSWLGLSLQGLGFAIAWGTQRDKGASFLPVAAPALDLALSVLAAVLAMASVLFAGAALRALDKQWSLTARVRDDHELIRHGPFAVVRHPIYTALFGLLLATAISLAVWWALPMAAAVYLLGSYWRTAREERLLSEMFGAGYADYRAQVPRLFPRLSRRA